ncbi:MAG TPA: T9SS type A sorting domain-containing protein [Flavobacteriaceae bacterium]|nr:T9SS type A sorting domain-containing protein [Flavobacteriaceae bacterium]HIN98963.1 T9SS type A sorting domain-containing protein [Flavobacteriaceae bacterium]|tara:strand:+ start:73277 stop:74002 length:726 start_codon:yes stop_codon:yes gene_type:complete
MKKATALLITVLISLNVFAQDPTKELYQNNWLLGYLKIDGEIVGYSFNSEINSVGIGFDTDGTIYWMGAWVCNGITTELLTVDGSSFSTTEFEINSNECNLPETLAFEKAYFEDFFKIDDPGHVFTYTIEYVGYNDLEMIITNEDGNQAFYGGKSILGVDDFESNTTLSVFPNPVTNNVNIASESLLQSIRIYDIQGREVYATQFQPGNPTINTEALKTGVYFLIAESDTGQQLTAKFVKK